MKFINLSSGEKHKLANMMSRCRTKGKVRGSYRVPHSIEIKEYLKHLSKKYSAQK